MCSNFRRVDAPDVLTTFAGFSEMLDRMHEEPLRLTPSRPLPMMARKPWGDQDDRLVEMYRLGWPFKRMGEELGRTALACKARLYFIGYGRE